MPNQQFQKAACAFCGGKIEFPASAQGMMVECPHCHRQTELDPIRKAAHSFWRLLIFAALGIVLAGAVLLFLATRKAPRVRTAPTAASTNAPSPPTPMGGRASPRAKSADDLRVLGPVSVEKAKGSRLSYAMGVLTNDSEHQRYGIRVELDLFDQAGNKLTAQANDYLQTLEPRKDWRFRALVLDGKATTAKVAAIKEEP